LTGFVRNASQRDCDLTGGKGRKENRMPNFYDEKKEEEGDIFDELMTLGLLCEHACRPRSAESECKSNSREMKIFIIFS